MGSYYEFLNKSNAVPANGQVNYPIDFNNPSGVVYVSSVKTHTTYTLPNNSDYSNPDVSAGNLHFQNFMNPTLPTQLQANVNHGQNYAELNQSQNYLQQQNHPYHPAINSPNFDEVAANNYGNFNTIQNLQVPQCPPPPPLFQNHVEYSSISHPMLPNTNYTPYTDTLYQPNAYPSYDAGMFPNNQGYVNARNMPDHMMPHTQHNQFQNHQFYNSQQVNQPNFLSPNDNRFVASDDRNLSVSNNAQDRQNRNSTASNISNQPNNSKPSANVSRPRESTTKISPAPPKHALEWLIPSTISTQKVKKDRYSQSEKAVDNFKVAAVDKISSIFSKKSSKNTGDNTRKFVMTRKSDDAVPPNTTLNRKDEDSMVKPSAFSNKSSKLPSSVSSDTDKSGAHRDQQSQINNILYYDYTLPSSVKSNHSNAAASDSKAKNNVTSSSKHSEGILNSGSYDGNVSKPSHINTDVNTSSNSTKLQPFNNIAGANTNNQKSSKTTATKVIEEKPQSSSSFNPVAAKVSATSVIPTAISGALYVPKKFRMQGDDNTIEKPSANYESAPMPNPTKLNTQSTYNSAPMPNPTKLNIQSTYESAPMPNPVGSNTQSTYNSAPMPNPTKLNTQSTYESAPMPNPVGSNTQSSYNSAPMPNPTHSNVTTASKYNPLPVSKRESTKVTADLQKPWRINSKNLLFSLGPLPDTKWSSLTSVNKANTDAVVDDKNVGLLTILVLDAIDLSLNDSTARNVVLEFRHLHGQGKPVSRVQTPAKSMPAPRFLYTINFPISDAIYDKIELSVRESSLFRWSKSLYQYSWHLGEIIDMMLLGNNQNKYYVHTFNDNSLRGQLRLGFAWEENKRFSLTEPTGFRHVGHMGQDEVTQHYSKDQILDKMQPLNGKTGDTFRENFDSTLVGKPSTEYNRGDQYPSNTLLQSKLQNLKIPVSENETNVEYDNVNNSKYGSSEQQYDDGQQYDSEQQYDDEQQQYDDQQYDSEQQYDQQYDGQQPYDNDQQEYYDQRESYNEQQYDNQRYNEQQCEEQQQYDERYDDDQQYDGQYDDQQYDGQYDDQQYDQQQYDGQYDQQQYGDQKYGQQYDDDQQYDGQYDQQYDDQQYDGQYDDQQYDQQQYDGQYDDQQQYGDQKYGQQYDGQQQYDDQQYDGQQPYDDQQEKFKT